MTRTLTSLLVALSLTATSGCVFVTKKPKHGHSEQHVDRRCKPSQHWENGHCVHNGRGKGARKHDD